MTLVGKRASLIAQFSCPPSQRARHLLIFAKVDVEDASRSMREQTLNVLQKAEKTAQLVKADSGSSGGRPSDLTGLVNHYPAVLSRLQEYTTD